MTQRRGERKGVKQNINNADNKFPLVSQCLEHSGTYNGKRIQTPIVLVSYETMRLLSAAIAVAAVPGIAVARLWSTA